MLARGRWRAGATPALALVLALAVALAGALATPAAQAQAIPSEPVLAADLREEVQHIPVTVKDLFGRQETASIALTVFRPPGDGPFPLAIVSHGRAPGERRAQQGRQRFEPLARYLVNKGFAVFVPTRVGYGDSYGSFDPEFTDGCNRMRPQAAAQAASDQVLATLAHAKTLPWVDASRWVAIGQSVGGLTTLAVVARQPPGLAAAINFAGGIGGNPATRPGDPCSPRVIEQFWKAQAATAPLPMLWLYWQNDLYWGTEWPVHWAQAWNDGGGRAQLHQLPAIVKDGKEATDGHGGMGADMDHWVPLVEPYLAAAGFKQTGVPQRPSPSNFAALDDASKLPATASVRSALYPRFLAARPPRAFAIGPHGQGAFATGDWAIGRALGFCQQRRGDTCKLYAVDDDVVWVP